MSVAIYPTKIMEPMLRLCVIHIDHVWTLNEVSQKTNQQQTRHSRWFWNPSKLVPSVCLVRRRDDNETVFG